MASKSLSLSVRFGSEADITDVAAGGSARQPSAPPDFARMSRHACRMASAPAIALHTAATDSGMTLSHARMETMASVHLCGDLVLRRAIRLRDRCLGPVAARVLRCGVHDNIRAPPLVAGCLTSRAEQGAVQRLAERVVDPITGNGPAERGVHLVFGPLLRMTRATAVVDGNAEQVMYALRLQLFARRRSPWLTLHTRLHPCHRITTAQIVIRVFTGCPVGQSIAGRPAVRR